MKLRLNITLYEVTVVGTDIRDQYNSTHDSFLYYDLLSANDKVIEIYNQYKSEYDSEDDFSNINHNPVESNILSWSVVDLDSREDEYRLEVKIHKRKVE